MYTVVIIVIGAAVIGGLAYMRQKEKKAKEQKAAKPAGNKPHPPTPTKPHPRI